MDIGEEKINSTSLLCAQKLVIKLKMQNVMSRCLIGQRKEASYEL